MKQAKAPKPSRQEPQEVREEPLLEENEATYAQDEDEMDEDEEDDEDDDDE